MATTVGPVARGLGQERADAEGPVTQVLDRAGIETIPTARDDDFCHISMNPLAITEPPYEAVCGVMVDEEPCCSGAPPCGRPVCPECQATLRRKGR